MSTTTQQIPTKTGREQIALAREAFDKLAPLNDQTHTPYRDKLFAMCKAEETQHRTFMPRFRECHTADTASVADAARLMAVKRVAEYMTGEEMPKGADFLHRQPSTFYAAGIADQYGDLVREYWADLSVPELAELDYTAIVKVKGT